MGRNTSFFLGRFDVLYTFEKSASFCHDNVILRTIINWKMGWKKWDIRKNRCFKIAVFKLTPPPITPHFYPCPPANDNLLTVLIHMLSISNINVPSDLDGKVLGNNADDNKIIKQTWGQRLYFIQYTFLKSNCENYTQL